MPTSLSRLRAHACATPQRYPAFSFLRCHSLRARAQRCSAAPARSAGCRPRRRTSAPHGSRAPVRFRVVIEAPRAYRQHARAKGLDLVRWQRDERVTMPLLERLVGRSAQGCGGSARGRRLLLRERDLAHRERRTVARPVVRITVEPGPRTRVRGVDLDVTGAALERPGRPEAHRGREGNLEARARCSRSASRDWDEAKTQALARLARGRYAAAQHHRKRSARRPRERAPPI